jgi:hypothetical protein
MIKNNIQKLEDEEKYDEYRDYSVAYLRKKLIRTINPKKRILIMKSIRRQSRIEEMKITMGRLEVIEERRGWTESEVSDSVQKQGSTYTEVINQNVTDITGADIDYNSSGPSARPSQGERNILEVSDYLKRPVEIYSTQLSLTADDDIIVDVWNLFTLIPSVRAKLRNYAFLRGNLHVRVAISGCPFHYGKVLASPQPWDSYNDNLAYLQNQYSLDTNARMNLLNYLSQAAGSCILSVNENKPAEIIFPFISPKPMHRLFNSTAAVGAATPFLDLEKAGSLYLNTITQVKAVSDNPTPAYLQVYAWMEETTFGTNTATQIAITTESKDERVSGPIETFASNMYQLSSALTAYTPIALYAKASSMFFGGLTTAAALMGWSKPIPNRKIEQLQNEPFHNGAITIGEDYAKRIVLDPMQELTVDPRFMGVDHDDMILSNLCARRTYLTTFSWLDDDPSMVGPIWTTAVTPALSTLYSNGGKKYIQPTAMAFAAMPFQFWRGDIIFRFEIVCSQFHRGKLAVFFEPNVNQYALINAQIVLNKQFFHIVDIQETQTFDVKVSWANAYPWLSVGNAATVAIVSDIANAAVSLESYTNGYLGVIPFTDLQSPDSSDITINVYVSSNNMQFNVVSTFGFPNERAELPDPPDMPFTESDICSSSSQEVSMVDLNKSTANTNGLCNDYFGEQPLSFRALLKRFHTNKASTTPASATGLPKFMTFQLNNWFQNNLPYGATSWTVDKDLFSYLKYAYMGMRGGLRLRYRMSTNVNSQPPQAMVRIHLDEPSSTIVPTESVTVNTTTNAGFLPINGGVSFVPITNGGISVELPFYSNNLYLYSFNDLPVLDASDHIMNDRYIKTHSIIVDVLTTGAVNAGYYSIDYASGEDFQFLRYQGAPSYTSV